jgi:menaquinone-9 beta-reductase
MTPAPGDGACGTYDIVLVGTGPAGSAFARSVSRAAPDLRLLAIEENRHPRDKVCGGALTYRALPLVRTLFPEVSSIPTTSFTRQYRICFPNGRSVARGDGEFDVVRRRVFDQTLWNAVRSDGVETLEDARVTGLLQSAGRVTGVSVERRSARWNVECRMVVGADGSTSVVRQCTGTEPSRSRGAAIRQYVRGVDPAALGLVFLIDPECHGYLWIFPFESEGERWANVGYFCHTGRGVDPRGRYTLMRQHEIARRYLTGATEVTSLQGFPLNLARTRWGRLTLDRPVTGPGYVLVGDAAGLVDPDTGEGIAFALHSGRIAGELAAESLDSAEWGPAYERRAVRFAQAADPTGFLPLVFRVPGALPRPVRDLYMRLLPWWLNRQQG